MSLIKKLVCVLLCLLFAVVLLPLKANAITIDGIMDTNSEWKNAKGTIISPYGTVTNCDINYAYMMVLVDTKNSAVYLSLQVMQQTPNALKPGSTSVGVRLNINPGTFITCCIGTEDEFDRTSFSVDKGIVIGTNNDFVLEMRIGYLHGVPEHPLTELQLIDSYGKNSNWYSFPVVQPTTLPAATTTKPVTTKPATTKPTTTKLVTTTATLYKIKFDSNGGRGGKTQSLPYGEKPIPPVVERDEYTFTSWSPAVQNVTGAATYKAQWLKNSTTSTTVNQTTSGRTPTVTNGNKTNGLSVTLSSNPSYTITTLFTTPYSDDKSFKNEATTYNESVSPQNSSEKTDIASECNTDKPDDASEGEVLPEHGTNGKNDAGERGSIGIKKHIAAVVAAAILLSLAVYFLILASKQKTQSKLEPETPPEETDKIDLDDDF